MEASGKCSHQWTCLLTHTHTLRNTLAHAEAGPSTIPHYHWVYHAPVSSYHSVSTWSMQMRPLWSPVPAWMPILPSSSHNRPERGAGLQHSHAHKHTQHSWGHSLSTSGARLLPPQSDKSPSDTQKKRRDPSVKGARFQVAPPISALLRATTANCYYPAPTGFGQRGGKKMRGRRVEKKRESQKAEMGREKEMGGRKRHLGSFIWWSMINGLAFSWSMLPQCSLSASSDKRVFEGEWTPQILLFVPDWA